MLVVPAALVVSLAGVPTDGPADSDGTTVTVKAERIGGQYSESVDVSGGRSGGKWECATILDWVEADSGSLASHPSFPAADPGRKAIKRYWYLCGDGSGAVVESRGYLYEDQVIDYDGEARTRAELFLQQRVKPTVAIGSSPPGRAIVGVAAWYWVEGYGTGARSETFDVFGRRLVLTLEPVAVRWDFGDGGHKTLSGADGFGLARQPTAVVHRYERRSTSAAAPEGTVTVTVEIDIAISYTLDGGGPYLVNPPLRTAAASNLVVREAQAVIR